LTGAGVKATGVGRVAVFDLDGTITLHDTLLPFLAGYGRRHPAPLWRLLRLPFSLARFGLGLSDRGALKCSLIRQVMHGATRRGVHEWAQEFCRERLPDMLIPGALAAIERHRSAGDRLVLLSASVDLYVPDIGRHLGFDETICTGVSWDGDRLEGRLTTVNRRGPEKARCVESLRLRYPQARFTAYGNASSDFDHLLIVDEPLVVNASRATRRRALATGLPCADWR
jgi:HAD superfamily hydrolase (TIGR01490 family)